jgi:2,3-dihydro-2,3-dihydroxybenzoate dehydrogenase
MLSRVMALELSAHNITVNVLCPGTTETEMAKGLLDKERIIRGDVNDFRTGIPLGRLAAPEDQAKMAVFLCSENSNFITGQLFVVDGGQSIA